VQYLRLIILYLFNSDVWFIARFAEFSDVCLRFVYSGFRILSNACVLTSPLIVVLPVVLEVQVSLILILQLPVNLMLPSRVLLKLAFLNPRDKRI
jgi:hypothetical protein